MVDYVKAHEHALHELRARLEAEGANVFTVEMLESAARTPEDLRRFENDFVVFVEPLATVVGFGAIDHAERELAVTR